LASEFAPVLHFTRGEKFYPTSVDYIISSSVLKLRSSNGSSTVIDPAPTPHNLGTHPSPDLFLDNKLGTLDAVSADYASKAKSIGYCAYVHIVKNDSLTVIQYWLFYSYNNGPLNDHQGDVEVITVFLDVSERPQRVLLSQHSSGQNALWSDAEKMDTHPVVYVAQGSHANYFRPYQGKIGIENDIVGSDGLTIMPNDLKLIILRERGNRPPEQSWLDYAGRWGYWGTDQEVALGMAGPLGPVFNQDGIRWAQPGKYLGQTFPVDGNYFILAWIAANFLLIFVIYTTIRSAWKMLGIMRLRRTRGLLVRKFLKGRGGLGLILGVSAILVTVGALALPWYSIVASSQTGPLSGQGGVNLMTVDGIDGMRVNMFLGSDSESSSGYRSLLSMQIPFALMIAAGLILLALDIIGVKNGKSIGGKFIIGAVISLLPFVLIYLFIALLRLFLPLVSSLAPDENIVSQLEQMVRTIAANPASGTTSQEFPTVGTATVSWGFGVGAYLFVVAAVMRVVAGMIVRSVPELRGEPSSPSQPPT